jgi:hypothetical protein
MLEPAIGIRGKVGIFRKYVLRTYIFLQLHEEALLTYHDVERIEWLHPVKLIGC